MHQPTAIQRGSFGSQMITGAQIRAARALVGWTSEQVATAAGVSYASISRAEQTDDVPQMRVGTLQAIQHSLETAGVIFLSEGDTRTGGPGVRLR